MCLLFRTKDPGEVISGSLRALDPNRKHSSVSVTGATGDGASAVAAAADGGDGDASAGDGGSSSSLAVASTQVTDQPTSPRSEIRDRLECAPPLASVDLTCDFAEMRWLCLCVSSVAPTPHTVKRARYDMLNYPLLHGLGWTRRILRDQDHSRWRRGNRNLHKQGSCEWLSGSQ